MSREVDLFERDKFRFVFDLVVKVYSEEYGDTDIRYAGAVPVDRVAREGRVVLTCCYDDAEQKCKDRAEREEGCFVRELGEGSSLCFERTTETIVADGDADPRKEACHTADVDEPRVCRTFPDKGGDEGRQTEYCRSTECRDRYAAFVELEEEFRSFASFGKSIEHTSRYIETRVACRENACQDDGIDEACRRDHTGTFEYERERTDGDVFDTAVKKVRVGIRDKETDNDERTHVEQHDTPEDGVNGFRNIFFRVFTFPRGDTDHLGTLEREACDHEDSKDGTESTDERSFADRPVFESRARCAEAQDEHRACEKEHDDRKYLDAREEEFAFTEGTCRPVVENEQYCEEYALNTSSQLNIYQVDLYQPKH